MRIYFLFTKSYLCLGAAGFYIFMEASSPVAAGDQVTMVSKTYDRPYCMSFWYHMWGGSMGTLYVKIVDGNTLFTITRNQGNTWHNWKIDVSNNCNPYQVSLNLCVTL